ncbi:MAG: CaiB/BaiF CoA-transferase family protein [Desulfomonilia bacterium]
MSALLEGTRVLDFSTLLPGPFATMVLADLGAEVLRIESPTRIDLARLAPPCVDNAQQISCMHAMLSRNKKSLAVDLKQPEGVALIERLIAEKGYDIIVEQFRPGVMERLGLSYERLSDIDEGLIYCSITGYGQDGPNRDRAGHDINYLSVSGVMGYSRAQKSGPSVMDIQVADIGSGSSNAVIGILAALIHRMKTGQGQHIDVSMTDGMFPYHVVSGLGALLEAAEPCQGRESGALNGESLYGFYETSDGEYLSFGGLEPKFLTEFLTALGLGQYLDRMLEPGIAGEIRDRVAQVIRSRPRDHWVEVFRDKDACVEPVLSVSESFSSEHAAARGLVVEVPGPYGRPVRQVAHPIRFSGYTPCYRWTGPCLGQHTTEVLTSLGMTAREIDDLKSRGVVAGT